MRLLFPALLLYGLLQTVLSQSTTTPDSTSFSWDKVIPSNNSILWTPCYTNRECGKLSVPLDYKLPNGPKASIALIRKKATISPSSPAYRGPILFNPGGPGGSGVQFISGATGDLLGSVVGPEFDVVSFDPRGIAQSTPKVSLFKAGVDRALYLNEDPGYIRNQSYEGVGRFVSRAKIVGNLAESVQSQRGYLKHIQTEYVARDMLAISTALGQKKLQYWGFSYGSTLGATFATMFPDRVQRMVVDGVGDAEDYYKALWESNLLDADKVLQTFFTGCASAGPTVCPFAADTSSAAEIEQKLNNLYDKVIIDPIPVVLPSGVFGLIDESILRNTVFGALYNPYALFPLLGVALADPEANAELFFQMSKPAPYDCSCDDPAAHDSDNVQDGALAFVCNDGDVVPDDIQSARVYYDKMSQMSQWGPDWGRTRIRCGQWPRFPKDHFRGPFVANTSFPILLVGNTADPVTPLATAKKMSLGFEGSIVLTQDSAGHVSISAPSQCTMQYIRSYFLNGTLPPQNTICAIDYLPFSSTNLDKQKKLASSTRETGGGIVGQVDITDVLHQLSQVRRPRSPWV